MTLEILRDMVKINTENPPGMEIKMVEYIKSFCIQEDIKYETIETAEGRGNIILEIGENCEEKIVALGHLDVVKASGKWSCDPFGAEVLDGYLYGRGTVDMKYFLASLLVNLKRLKKDEKNLKKGVIAVFSADEERGSEFGLKKLLDEERIKDIFRDNLVLNEGGGFYLNSGEKDFYLIETGQKSVSRIDIRLKASKDYIGYFPNLDLDLDTAKIIKLLNKIDFEKGTPRTTQNILDKLEVVDKKIAPLINGMSKSFVTPTIIEKAKGRAPEVSIKCDCRLLPNISKEEFIKKLEGILLPFSAELIIDSFTMGYEIEGEHQSFKVIEQSLNKNLKNKAEVLPFITPGSNDGRYLGPLNSSVIGFAPISPKDSFIDILPLLHNVDERISLESIDFCTEVLGNFLTTYLMEE